MRKALVFLTMLVFALPAFGQWRRAALYGADVRALVIDPSHPDTLFLGTSGGEVYVSNNGARSWQNPRNSVPFPGYVVDSLVIDRDGRLWAACWGLWGGGVIAVSADGGRTWSRRDAGLEDFSVRAIAVDPRDANFVIIGGLSGVYRSTDAGRSWEKISEQINVESLALDPRTHDRIYVGTWRQGIRTDDRGKSWYRVSAESLVVNNIALHPQRPHRIVLGVEGDGIYVSDDDAKTFTRSCDGLRNLTITSIAADPAQPKRVYASVMFGGASSGIYVSDDAALTWRKLSA